ncbi:unnamed protein product [Vitrella brassicaformis CCMP3155]|uniref:Uncharacterized protein n=1 Tax=Vitrella brassicaformis (strain CCMP3155) TaxID=1169540 RepID=A0A0G4F4S6_VITBC|nr:unnamed protein product [Vitrella brassicaformis CCMP3155]|eukprot:CEM06934.1 unnamed protein product [Vitrella brassicaformis CCMP3155]
MVAFVSTRAIYHALALQRTDGLLVVYKCKEMGLCPGGLVNTTHQSPCREHTYGRTCSACENGYWLDEDRCRACPMMTPVFLSSSAGLLLVLWFCYFAFDMDTTEISGVPAYEFAASLNSLIFFLESVTLYGKIDLTWPKLAKEVIEALEVIPLDFVIPEFGCLWGENYTLRFTTVLMCPLAIPGGFVVLWLMSWVVARVKKTLFNHRSKPLRWNKIFNSCGVLFEVLYISLSHLMLMPFHCSFHHSDGSRSNYQYPEIICYSSKEWMRLMTPAAVGLFFYGLCLNVSWIYILRIAPRESSNSRDFQERFRFLFLPYNSDVYWWSLVLIYRHLLTSVMVTFVEDPFLKVLLVQGILLTSALLQAHFWPWRAWYVNWNDEILIILQITMLALLKSDANKRRWAFVLLDIVILTAIVVAASFFIFFFCRLATIWLTTLSEYMQRRNKLMQADNAAGHLSADPRRFSKAPRSFLEEVAVRFPFLPRSTKEEHYAKQVWRAMSGCLRHEERFIRLWSRVSEKDRRLLLKTADLLQVELFSGLDPVLLSHIIEHRSQQAINHQDNDASKSLPGVGRLLVLGVPGQGPQDGAADGQGYLSRPGRVSVFRKPTLTETTFSQILSRSVLAPIRRLSDRFLIRSRASSVSPHADRDSAGVSIPPASLPDNELPEWDTQSLPASQASASNQGQAAVPTALSAARVRPRVRYSITAPGAFLAHPFQRARQSPIHSRRSFLSTAAMMTNSRHNKGPLQQDRSDVSLPLRHRGPLMRTALSALEEGQAHTFPFPSDALDAALRERIVDMMRKKNSRHENRGEPPPATSSPGMRHLMQPSLMSPHHCSSPVMPVTVPPQSPLSEHSARDTASPAPSPLLASKPAKDRAFEPSLSGAQNKEDDVLDKWVRVSYQTEERRDEEDEGSVTRRLFITTRRC